MTTPDPTTHVPDQPATDMPHNRPTIAELVEAVREFLETDVMAATAGRTGFHVRVAVNVLAMIERELREGPRHRREHAARLARLGVADDAELAAAIRAGRLDDRHDEVFAAVWDAVVAKLEVANPRYLSPSQGPERA